MKIKDYTVYQIELLEIRVPCLAKQLENGMIGEIEALERAFELTGDSDFLPEIKDLGEPLKAKPEEHGKRYARAIFKRIAQG